MAVLGPHLLSSVKFKEPVPKVTLHEGKSAGIKQSPRKVPLGKGQFSFHVYHYYGYVFTAQLAHILTWVFTDS